MDTPVTNPNLRVDSIPSPAQVPLTSAQKAWVGKLQQCESRGNPNAINPKDRDGTPSYYSFQFKPSTFRSYGEQYGVIPRGLINSELMEALKRTDLQRAIVEHMIHDPYVRWSQQFPDCTKNYIGMPPDAASSV